jgi:hypothetical protein
MARMNIEDVIRELERRHPECTRGKTAKPGSKYYEAASDLDFHECTCARNDPAYFRGYAEFVAGGPAGGATSSASIRTSASSVVVRRDTTQRGSRSARSDRPV